LAYVTNTGDGTLSVIDVGRRSVLNTLPVLPTGPNGGLAYGVAVTADGGTIFVTNGRGAEVRMLTFGGR
jgi:YVTN family beta-propeller protein